MYELPPYQEALAAKLEEADIRYQKQRARQQVYQTFRDPGKYNAMYAHHAALRRAQQLQATPLWANLSALKLIYKNRPEGYHVDHIVPLNHHQVCGLHCEDNLQYLPALENIQKSNHFDI